MPSNAPASGMARLKPLIHRRSSALNLFGEGKQSVSAVAVSDRDGVDWSWCTNEPSMVFQLPVRRALAAGDHFDEAHLRAAET